jgi:hypothetical protein
MRAQEKTDGPRQRRLTGSDVVIDGAATAQFSKSFDEPGQRTLISGLEANRDLNFNANLWREAGQGASFSIQKYSSTGDEIRPLKHPLSPVFSWLRLEARLDTCSS